MAAPTFVSAVQTASWGTSHPKTMSVAVQAGDIIVVCGGSENSPDPIATPSDGVNTYTAQQTIVTAGFGATYVWTATAATSTTLTITVDLSAGAGNFGAITYVFRNSGGVGNSAQAHVNPGAPAVSLTTFGANSAVVVFNNDGVPVDGTTRTWRTVNSITPSAGNGLEKLYQKNGTIYATYSAYWNDAGAAGANTYGLTAPTGQGYAIIAVEVLGSGAGTARPAAWRPDIAVQVAFNAGPNDPTAVPIWSDLTARFRKASRVQRGRQYELDQSQGSQPQLTFFDQDEALNPANPLSPYAPNVLPYRQILWQAMWPNTTVGNLLNTGYGPNASLGTVNGYDPTFESYAAGATVPWIAAVGGTAPVVGTTTPHGGAKDLTWAVVNGATVQGVSMVVPCIPGRQYTTSAYVQQSSASTQQIAVSGVTTAYDNYSRTATSSWGNADFGGAWTISQDGGTTADYNVAGGAATMSNAATSARHRILIGSSMGDADTYVTTSIPVVTAGAPIESAVLARYTDPNNLYYGGVWFNTDGSVTGLIVKRVAGVQTTITSGTIAGLTYAAGTQLRVRFTVTGSSLSLKVWAASTVEPKTYNLTTTDTAITAAGQVGMTTVVNGGNTNTLPVATSYSRFFTTGSVVGTNTAATGAYQRLSVTFTASQPVHTMQLATTGTAVAGTALLDDIQHEQSASPSTFTTTGPTIYGVFRGYVERWPSQWGHMGYLGEANVTCVDAFGPQNLIKLSTEYRNAVLAKRPAYYWPLGEPQTATSFGDASGNAGPPLVKYNLGIGAATFAPATSTNIAGDPSGTGVAITGNTPTVLSDLEAGPAGPTITIGSNQATWGMSFSMWLNTTDTSANDLMMQTIAAPSGPGPALVNLLGPATPNFGVQSSGGLAFCAAPASYGDGKWHHYVGTISQAGGNLTITLYVDNVQVATNTVNVVSTFGVSTPDFRMQWAQLAGMSRSNIPNTFNNTPITNGTYAHFALWSRALSTSEITDLWTAGKGYPGETTGQRLSRYMSYSWPGLTVIDTGQSAMGVSDTAAGTSLLAAAQAIATTENGNYWVDDLGNSTFAARTRRYLATTSLYTFGERVDLGEIPYEGDIAFDFDLTLVYNDIEIDNANGVIVFARDAASQLAYFPRAYQRSINVKDNNEAVDAATYLLNGHKQPHLRVQSIVLDPAKTTNWGVVLALEVGQRVTVKRRASAANGGAGLTIQGDFFVENVAVEQVDLGGGVWTVRLYLSPVDTTQVGILDNGVYGRLATGGAQLNAGITAAATTAVVNLTSNDLFTTSGTFQALIDSELVTVTAVAGGASPQTLTITRPTDGTAVAHASGAPVQVYRPFVLAY